MVKARGECGRPIRGGNRAKAKNVELIEQQFHVRRDVVRDENYRCICLRSGAFHEGVKGER